MKPAKEAFKVLLIGERPGSFSRIVGRLEKGGCRCRFAKSYEEARESIASEAFDLVLSAAPPRDNAIASITSLLSGSGASFFYALPVEESCWWLPALRQGKRCFGAPALRPGEFTTLLDEVVAASPEASPTEPRTPLAPVRSSKPKRRSGALPAASTHKTRS